MSEHRPPEGAGHPFEALSGRDDHAVWDAIAHWRAAGRRFALLTVTETRGFTPRKAGAHMLVSDDAATWGTIGGGAIEREAIEGARAMLAAGEPARTLRRHLTQELGMCCGGEMAVHMESVGVPPRVLVLGAGYIGRALAALAAGCGYRVVVVDERPEWAEPATLPFATVWCRAPDAFVREAPPQPADSVVIVTHDHALDQRLVEALIRAPLVFLGLVGSIPKRRKFVLRLRARGFTDGEIARLRTPLGIAIGAATPEEIAVSVMAELIASRRGIELPGGDAVPLRHGSTPERHAGPTVVAEARLPLGSPR